MGRPAAKQGDKVLALDTHIVMIPSPGGPVPTPIPMPFDGALSGDLSQTVFIDDKPAAIEGSTATNTPAHIPAGGPFQTPPSNKATIQSGSATVFMDGKGAARTADPAMTCNDPADAPNGKIVASGTVLFIG